MCAEHARPKGERTFMTSHGSVTVLILDDNPLVLKLGRALLEREGCTGLTASSGIAFNHVLAANYSQRTWPIGSRRSVLSLGQAWFTCWWASSTTFASGRISGQE
mgnify:CR=1 FL=1